MSTSPTIELTDASREFYGNPENYSPFSLTKDHLRIVGCIDPRDPTDESKGDYKIMINTAGAGVGEGLDTALAQTAATNQFFSLEQGIEDDKRTRVSTVLGAHYACRFVGGLPTVLGEMASPSEYTLDTVTRTAQELGLSDMLHFSMRRISSAAKEHQEVLAAHQQSVSLDTFVEHVDRIHPGRPNVKRMRGDNISRVYVTNLHPNVGIDRNNKPDDEEQATLIQGYHDSLAASLGDLANVRSLPYETRQLRAAALLLRSAATRSVLTADHLEEMTFYTVRPAHDGLKIDAE